MSVLAVRARFGLLGSPYLFEVGIRLCSELAAVALQRQIRLEESRCAAVPVRLIGYNQSDGKIDSGAR